ncbi:MAG: hypothetical protein PUC39_09600 [Lachnospiraceae bacterium]|nr:hypothetical protein [Lachnospiraceae bacterium]
MGRKLAVLFPGVGYNCDKPLLHYARRIFTETGYETVLLKYKKDTFSDGRVTEEGVSRAYYSVTKQLREYSMEKYEDIVFIGKSVGTLLAFMLGEDYTQGKNRISSIRYIALTPLSQTFPYMQGKTVLAVSGTKDPVVPEVRLRELAEQYNVDLHLYTGGNHSLEVRNHPEQSVVILAELIHLMQEFTK